MAVVHRGRDSVLPLLPPASEAPASPRHRHGWQERHATKASTLPRGPVLLLPDPEGDDGSQVFFWGLTWVSWP